MSCWRLFGCAVRNIVLNSVLFGVPAHIAIVTSDQSCLSVRTMYVWLAQLVKAFAAPRHNRVCSCIQEDRDGSDKLDSVFHPPGTCTLRSNLYSWVTTTEDCGVKGRGREMVTCVLCSGERKQQNVAS